MYENSDVNKLTFRRFESAELISNRDLAFYMMMPLKYVFVTKNISN